MTTANTQKVSSNGDIAVHTQVIKRPIEVILTIGIFFDGTANNSFNTARREEYQQALALGEDPDIEFPVFNTSYENEHSNIHKLHQMYVEHRNLSEQSKDNNGVIHYQRKIYIEGVGTEVGKADSNIGLGTGLGPTGIKGKINRAIVAIHAQLADFFDKNPKTRIQQIRYDVFGFSRGAATARYFANIVADKLKHDDRRGDNNPLTKMLVTVLDGKVSDKWQGNSNGQVRFLGLFDTVAGICRPSNLFDAGDANTFDIDIKIRRESAQCGLQIQAANEYRHNFSLNDVPDFFNKVIVPGAHSDIGGGYPNHDLNENLYITDIHRKYNLYLSSAHHLEELLQQDLERFKRHSDLRYLFSVLSRDNFYIWQDKVRYDNSNYTNAFGVIRVTRRVKFGLDRIALRMMYNEAVKQGCHFGLFDSDYNIPNELQTIANKILLAAKNYQRYLLSDSEQLLLLGHYVHCSAEYERFFYGKEAVIEVIEKSSGLPKKIKWKELYEKEQVDTNLLKVHAPRINQQGDWQRQIHPN